MSDQENQVGEAAAETTAVQLTVTGRKIVAKHNALVDVVRNIFKFRKSKDKETGVESQRASVTLDISLLSVEGVVDILENADSRPKELELLMGAVHDLQLQAVKDHLNDNPDLTGENFPIDKFTWAEIANAPESERSGRGIDKETMAEFAKDYIEVMPAATGKTVAQIEKQAAIMLSKFNHVRNHVQRDQILDGFTTNLALYVEATKNLEDFAVVVEYLTKRIEALKAAEIALTDALGF